MVVNRPHVLARNAYVRAVLVIRVVAKGDQCVEPIVAAGKLQDHERLSGRFGLACDSGGGLRE